MCMQSCVCVSVCVSTRSCVVVTHVGARMCGCDLLILTYLLLLLRLLRLAHDVLFAHANGEALLEAAMLAEAAVIH